MAASIAFWLFMAFLFGASVLALVMGYIGTEERRAQEKREQAVQDQLAAQAMAMIPRFFARPDATHPATAGVTLDDRLLADLESFVQAEQTLVTQFVSEPSVENLYRQPSVGMFN